MIHSLNCYNCLPWTPNNLTLFFPYTINFRNLLVFINNQNTNLYQINSFKLSVITYYFQITFLDYAFINPALHQSVYYKFVKNVLKLSVNTSKPV